MSVNQYNQRQRYAQTGRQQVSEVEMLHGNKGHRKSVSNFGPEYEEEHFASD